MKKITVIFVLLQICFFNSFGQEDQTQDNNFQYFDDGIASGKNILKVNILSSLSGDVSVSYERVLNHDFSVEVRGGIIRSHYVPDFFSIGEYLDNKDEFLIKGGYSLGIQPRYYYHSAPELYYTALQLRTRHYILESQDMSFNDLYIITGTQKIIGENWVLDVSIGIGARLKIFEIESLDGSSKYQLGGVFPFSIKVGYIF